MSRELFYVSGHFWMVSPRVSSAADQFGGSGAEKAYSAIQTRSLSAGMTRPMETTNASKSDLHLAVRRPCCPVPSSVPVYFPVVVGTRVPCSSGFCFTHIVTSTYVTSGSRPRSAPSERKYEVYSLALRLSEMKMTVVGSYEQTIKEFLK